MGWGDARVQCRQRLACFTERSSLPRSFHPPSGASRQPQAPTERPLGGRRDARGRPTRGCATGRLLSLRPGPGRSPGPRPGCGARGDARAASSGTASNLRGLGPLRLRGHPSPRCARPHGAAACGTLRAGRPPEPARVTRAVGCSRSCCSGVRRRAGPTRPTAAAIRCLRSTLARLGCG